MLPKISIVTPCFNQVNYIEDCILSILDQGYPNLEYIIVDGGSSDGTVDIIKKYEPYLKFWVSENDSGIYNALNKGFAKSTGEIMGWLNSDDMLHQKSLFTIQEVFSNFKEIKWLQGFPTIIEEKGRIVSHREARASKFSFYMKEYHDGIFIQQESTYWRRSLWEASGGYVSETYKYASDFELWMRFFNLDKLYVTDSLIGAFRIRKEGQLSSLNYKTYLDECDKIISNMIPTLCERDKKILRNLETIKQLKRIFKNVEKWPKIDKYIDKHMYQLSVVNFNFKLHKFKR